MPKTDITPNDDKDINVEDQTPKGTTGANADDTGKLEDLEKRLKDNQTAFHTERQERVAMAKLLVDENPANIEKIPDEKIRNKILEEKWGVENLDELKMLYPDALKPKKSPDEDDELDRVEKMERELNLIKYRETKTKTKDAIEGVIKEFGDVAETIPDIEDKIKEEMKNISESLEPKERAKRALNIVASIHTNSADAYSIMQGVSIDKTKRSEEVDDKALLKKQNELRELLGLKKK